MLNRMWLDAVIDSAVQAQDAQAVAQALVGSDKLLGAIKTALESGNPPANIRGPSLTQHVRQAIISLLMEGKSDAPA